MYILNSFTEVDIICFGCMELKKIISMFAKKVKTPSCYFEKYLNTPLSFTLKKVFAPLHSAPVPFLLRLHNCSWQSNELLSFTYQIQSARELNHGIPRLGLS